MDLTINSKREVSLEKERKSCALLLPLYFSTAYGDRGSQSAQGVQSVKKRSSGRRAAAMQLRSMGQKQRSSTRHDSTAAQHIIHYQCALDLCMHCTLFWLSPLNGRTSGI